VVCVAAGSDVGLIKKAVFYETPLLIFLAVFAGVVLFPHPPFLAGGVVCVYCWCLLLCVCLPRYLFYATSHQEAKGKKRMRIYWQVTRYYLTNNR
jgi:hypothetical protein